MKFFFFAIMLIGFVFIADKTCPSYDKHYFYITDQVFANSGKANDLSEFFVKNILGSGFNALSYTKCSTLSLAEQFQIASMCRYNDGKIKFSTLGIFDKIILLK